LNYSEFKRKKHKLIAKMKNSNKRSNKYKGCLRMKMRMLAKILIDAY